MTGRKSSRQSLIHQSLRTSLQNVSDSELERALAKHNLQFYLEWESQCAWRPAVHLGLLCSKLEAVERGEIRRLMVFMPPRHGKSEVVSKKFPAWYLGRNPDREIILTSYADALAYDFSRIARDTLREHGSLWGVRLAQGSSAVGRWGIEGHRGGLMAAGVGGPITGRGAHVAIIDDPVKNYEDALSKTIRDKVFDWYQSTLRTRLAPGGAIVLVMTRWHEDDLAGRLLARDSDQWEVISLPARAEPGDPLDRKLGQPLWPERFGEDELTEIERDLGSQKWTALYQQRPSPMEGDMLRREWWRYYTAQPARFDEVIQSWDMTYKDEDDSDYVVGQVWGRIDADKYLLDQVRARMAFPATVRAVQRLAGKWPEARTILIEDTANGPAVISTLRSQIPGIIPVRPMGSKVARVSAASPQIEAGNVYIPHPSIASWVEGFVEECAAFPNGVNDDQVDAMSQALNRLHLRQARKSIHSGKGARTR